MIPHESALFSRGCKLTSLWDRPLSGHDEGVCISGAVVCPLLVTPTRRFGGYAWSEHIDVYAFSRGSLWKTAWNLIETAQRKSQVNSPALIMASATPFCFCTT